MRDLIEIFKMTEITVDARIRLLKKMVNIVNMQYGSNVAEPIVEELVQALERQKRINKGYDE